MAYYICSHILLLTLVLQARELRAKGRVKGDPINILSDDEEEYNRAVIESLADEDNIVELKQMEDAIERSKKDVIWMCAVCGKAPCDCFEASVSIVKLNSE